MRGRLTFRVGSIVHGAFSPDETVMGFAFPQQERADLVDNDPRFHLPSESDQRFHWVHGSLPELGATEARELVVEAWRMVVPPHLSRAHDVVHPDGPG